MPGRKKTTRKKTSRKKQPATLRERAEQLLRTRPTDVPALPTRDVQTLLQELSVYQAELEIQNEELRQSQTELAEARDRYADLYEFAPVGYVTLDGDGKIVEANLTAGTMLGVDRRKLTGTNISRRVAPEFQDDCYLHRKAALEGDNKQVVELVMHGAGDSLMDVRMETLAYGSEDNRHLRVALIDIREKKRAERALQQLNEHLEQRVHEQTDEISLLATAISNLGEGVLITNDHLDWPGPHTIFVNDAMCRITGYTADELIGESPRILQGEETDRGTLDYIKNELSAGRMCMTELINYRKDGTPYHAEVFMMPMFDVHHHRTHFVSIHRDISDRKRAEEALRSEHELSEGMINMAQHIVLLIDTQGRIERFNPYLEDLTGWRLEEVRGKDWFETFLPAISRDQIHKRFDSALHGKRTRAGINTIVTRDGRELEIEWYDAPLTDAEGNLIGLLCTGQDISERKRAEEALQQSYEQLEQRVHERTIDLERAKRKAEQADASKSRFLAAASHDLRQPLQSIGMYLSVLSRERGLTKAQLEVCDKINASLDTTNKLLDALLDISRLESGAIIPEQKDFPLRDVMDWIITDNKPQAEEKGLRLEYALCDSLVHTDPLLLERIIENFVSNAIRYTERGGVFIECRPGLDKTVIAVTDTGIGIPADELQLIFEEYYQLENPMRERHKGLGLGLSIARHIAELLGHRLDVHSEPGKGSTFSIEIPLGKPALKKPVSRAEITDIDNAAQLVVLLVENDEAVADATIMLLKTANTQVYWATCADDALTHISDGVRPDVLVCDYRLPGEKGTEVIQRVRQATDSNLPALILTGDTSLKKSEITGLGNCTMLHKPVDANRLIALIGKIALKK